MKIFRLRPKNASMSKAKLKTVPKLFNIKEITSYESLPLKQPAKHSNWDVYGGELVEKYQIVS